MRILFTGYAPVHFVCFKPLYDELLRIPGVDVFVSGGHRHKTPAGTVYELAEMYGPLGVPPERMLPVERIRDEQFDRLFCANTKTIEPRRVERRIQVFHGMSFRNLASREDNLGFDHYFVLGPYMLRGFVQRELFQPGDPRAVEIGFINRPPTRRQPRPNGHLARRRAERRAAGDPVRPDRREAQLARAHGRRVHLPATRD